MLSKVTIVLCLSEFQIENCRKTICSLKDISETKEIQILLSYNGKNINDLEPIIKIDEEYEMLCIKSQKNSLAEQIVEVMAKVPDVGELFLVKPGVIFKEDFTTLLRGKRGQKAILATPILMNTVLKRTFNEKNCDRKYFYTDFIGMSVEAVKMKSKEFVAKYEENRKSCYALSKAISESFVDQIEEMDARFCVQQEISTYATRNEFLDWKNQQIYIEAKENRIVDVPVWWEQSEVHASANKREKKGICSVHVACVEGKEPFLDRFVEQFTLNKRKSFEIVFHGWENDAYKNKCISYKLRYPQNIILEKDKKNIKSEYITFMNLDDSISSTYVECAEHFMKKGVDILLSPEKNEDTMWFSGFSLKPYYQKNLIIHSEKIYGLGLSDIHGCIIKRELISDLEDLPKILVDVWKHMEAGCEIGWLGKTYFEKKEQISLNDFFEKLNTFWKSMLNCEEEISYIRQFSFIDELQHVMKFGLTEQRWTDMKDILSVLEDNVIIDSLGMHDMSRIIFIMQKKYNRKPDFVIENKDIRIDYPGVSIGMASYQSAVIHFIKQKDNKLNIVGETSIPACFEDDVTMYVEVNGKLYEAEMLNELNDYKIFDETYEYRRRFSVSIDLKQPKTAIRFAMKLQGQIVFYHNLIGMRFSPVSNEMKHGYYFRDEFMIKMRKGEILCLKADEKARNKQESIFQQELYEIGSKEAKYAALFRQYIPYFEKKKRKQIWLFYDRIDKADDNGEAMFRYMRKIKPEGIECYYIINKNSSDYIRLQSLGNIIPAHSAKHRMLHVLADYILTSQANSFVENPFGTGEMFYRDYIHRPKVIFLQHGITKDDQTRWMNRYNQDFHAIIVSSKKEEQSFLESDYYYKKENIWLTGMPRLDALYHEEQKKILLMPTWRKSLMELRWEPKSKVYKWTLKKGYETNSYFENYSSLLQSKRLKRMCKQYGYKLVFVPHPQIQPYKKLFRIPKWIEVPDYSTSWRELFATCDAMITDYSSVAFDFAYLRKPVFYYQFDKEEFFEGHTYKEGYFDYEHDGFGEVSNSLEELLDEIEEGIKSNCVIKEKYERRIQNFFDGIDGRCCEQMYQKIIGEQKSKTLM